MADDTLTSPPGDQHSILAVLHPDGFLREVLVLGEACPATLARPAGDPSSRSFGLIVLAPSADECRRAGWLRAAVETAGARLEEHGRAYIIVPRRWRATARRLLAGVGLEIEQQLLHLPSTTRTRHLVTLERARLDYLLSTLVSWRRWERHVGALVGRLPAMLTRSLPSVGLLARRPGARPALAWLHALAQNDGEPGSIVVSRSWHVNHEGLVLHVFEPGAEAPWALAKLRLDAGGDARTLAEAETLDRLGPGAAAAGAVVPHRLATGRVGRRRVLLESAVPGTVAALALHATPRRLDSVLEHTVDWLAHWHELTAERAPVTRAELDRELLRPAATLASGIADGGRYGRWLTDRCVAAEGRSLPRVAVHNDLTMWNILLHDTRLGVVDWEGAAGSGLPLGDFYYAVVDAVAAVRAYRDRHAAFEECFAPGGRHVAMVTRLHDRLIHRLGLARDEAELCFHACWLRHAVDPRRAAHLSDREPFLQIVSSLARDVVAGRRLPTV